MNYQLKMSGGETYVITEKEAQDLMLGDKKGLVGINSLKGVINMSFVSSIVPEDKVDKSKQTTGYLHDGTMVVKRYGIWVNANDPEIKLDPEYYPEVYKDEVMSKEEYEAKNGKLQTKIEYFDELKNRYLLK